MAEHPFQTPSADELTRFLNELSRGKDERSQTLMPFVYEQLRVLAASQLRGPGGGCLQPTELVNEAFLKLFDPGRVEWNDRRHFFALASKAMRQLVVDHARSRGRQKRGGDLRQQTLDEAFVASQALDVDVLDLDEALQELTALDERQARIVELRYFGGLAIEDIAAVLLVSKSTVEREWRAARAWLGAKLERDYG